MSALARIAAVLGGRSPRTYAGARRRRSAVLAPDDPLYFDTKVSRKVVSLLCVDQRSIVGARSSQNESPSAAATRTSVRTVGLTEPSSRRCQRL